MDSIIKSITGLTFKERIRDDDTIDQLHHFVTVYMLAAFALLIGIREYTVGNLDCYYTNYTIKHFQEHVNAYCWSHKLYRYPNPDNLSQVPYELVPEHGGPQNVTNLSKEDLGEINFYRWITVVFLLQAFMFKLPNLIWTECNEYSGTQIEKIVAMIASSSFEPSEKRTTMFKTVAEFLETWLKINRKPFWFMKSRIGRETKKILQNWMLCVGANTGNYLSTMYLVIKSMFLVNVFVQFFILSAFLDFSFWSYGIKALQMFQRENQIDDVHFPRVALCHFQAKGQGSWVQCLLTINMLLEKLFVLEWFWMFILLILTLYSFIAWIIRVLRTYQSVKFISKYLSVVNDDGSLPQEGKRTVLTFIRDYLGNDGIFILRILATNTNDVVMSDLVTSVWQRYVDYKNTAVRPNSIHKPDPVPTADIVSSDGEKNQLDAKVVTENTELNIG